MRRVVAVAAALLTVGLLSGCGGDSKESADFCALAAGDANALSSLASGSTGFDGMRKDFEKLVKVAPDEVKGDIKVVSDVITGIAQAFKDAGITDKDFAALQSGDTSALEDIDDEKFGRAMEKMSDSFDEDKLDKSYENLAKYADEECGVTLEPLE